MFRIGKINLDHRDVNNATKHSKGCNIKFLVNCAFANLQLKRMDNAIKMQGVDISRPYKRPSPYM